MSARGTRSGLDLAAFQRRSGIENLDEAETKRLRAYLARLSVAKRIREIFVTGAAIAEPAIDRVWGVLDREPTADEYLALAAIMREAARACEKDARARRSAGATVAARRRVANVKVYHWQGHRHQCPPAPNGGQQTREVVATTSKRKVRELLGVHAVPLSEIGTGANKMETDWALLAPGVIFWKPLDYRGPHMSRAGEGWPE